MNLQTFNTLKCICKQTLPFLLVTFLSCGNGNNNMWAEVTGQPFSGTNQLPANSLQQQSLNQQDTIPGADSLASIRTNFRRINAITNWTKKETRPLSESTEGGEATFYYAGKQLEKIVTKNFGEMFQQLTEYYLLKRDASFVFEKTFKYNRPIYYDSVAMKANIDTAAFDFDKSETIESRNYFLDGKLVQQINNPKSAVPSTKKYLNKEQQRIKKSFDDLMKLSSQQ